MASLSGVSSSNTVSSLMNSANTITGLASGLDTESMIENLVKSYQTKIETLNQKTTKIEWKQDAYRSIISKMVGFSSKYTSYTSGSNLTSPGFFNSAVKVETQGLFADRVSASGKTSSNISLDEVAQLATSAQYRTGSNLKSNDGRNITAEKGIDIVNGTTELSKLNGSLILTYGSNTVSVQFDEVADVKALKEIKEKNSGISEEEALGKLIEQKLADQQISLSGGKTDTADNRIKVEVKDGVLTFSDKSSAGNYVYISGASEKLNDVLGMDLENAEADKLNMIQLPLNVKTWLTKNVNNADYLSGKAMNLSLDGTTKQIKMPSIRNGKLVDENGGLLKDSEGNDISVLNAENYTRALNDAVQKAFKGNKIKVTNADTTNDTLKLNFEVQEGSDLVINTDVGESLQIGRTATSYLNTGKTLEDLLGKDALSKLEPAIKLDANGHKMTDSKGEYILDKDEKTGEQKYEFVLNGVSIGRYTKDTKLSDILSDINGSSEAGVRVSYSQTTKNFLFTSKDTGLESEITMGEGLAQAMFGSTEPEDRSSSTFAEAYGVGWLNGENVSFKVSGMTFHHSIPVSNTDTLEDVAQELTDTLFRNYGYTASYNKYTGGLELRDKSGAAVNFEMWIDDPMLGHKDLELQEEYKPTVDYTPGQDAKFTVTVNGEQKTMTRSSNSVSIDGLTITMKDTFNGKEDANGSPAVDSAGKAKNAVTFKSTTDSDKIVDAVKAMIEDYNTMMSEIKSAYGTMPYQKSNGSFANYEPLTEEERSGMSESAIERYEAKAKQGILFGDRNLSNLYDKLRNVFSPAGADGATLRAMGISTSFSVSDGSQAVTLDEDKLRAMLDSDPDRVADVFTKSTGVMQNMKTQLDMYSKTTGEPKGILIQQAGSPLSSLSLMNNSWQKEIDNITTQVEKWQDKLESQVERYTQQFSRLEVLINQMNAQSSSLAGMLGG